MKNYLIGWREVNKKDWYDRLCPELLWIAIFLAIFITIFTVMAITSKFDPGEMIMTQRVEIPDEWIKTPLDAKIKATESIIGAESYQKEDQEPRYVIGQSGVASWYDYYLEGKEWSKTHDTCATQQFKRYGSLKVTNIDNGKSVTCYINDYGPETCEYRYKYKLDEPGECVERIVDLSSHAFNQIADLKIGLINIKVEEIN